MISNFSQNIEENIAESNAAKERRRKGGGGHLGGATGDLARMLGATAKQKIH
jgi:hypothetical protein